MPKPSTLESVAIIAGIGIVGYIAYRVYKGGSDVAAAIGDAVSTVTEPVAYAAKRVYHSTIGGPSLSSLPSNGDYPEAGPIRTANERADIEQRIITMDQSTDTDFRVDAMGNPY